MLCACKDQQDGPNIQGAWNSVTYPPNYYLFGGDGILEIHTVLAGQIIVQKWFTYEHNQQSSALEVRDRDGLYFQGAVSFSPNADTVTLMQDGGINIVLARW